MFSHAGIYSRFSNIAQLIVLVYGIYLITHGQFTVGLLISFIAYAQNFYLPLQQYGGALTGFQTTMASCVDRIAVILELEVPEETGSDNKLAILLAAAAAHPYLLEFEGVSVSIS